MIDIISTPVIKVDGSGNTGRFNGRLDKIAIKLGRPDKNVHIIIKTDENELVHDNFFKHDDSPIEVIYPFIIVENLMEGRSQTKDFFLNNSLYYEIRGLGDDNYVEYIRFYVEVDPVSSD